MFTFNEHVTVHCHTPYSAGVSVQSAFATAIPSGYVHTLPLLLPVLNSYSSTLEAVHQMKFLLISM
jgi:hypothetical protein